MGGRVVPISLAWGLTSTAISLGQVTACVQGGPGTGDCLCAEGSLPSIQVAEMQATCLGVCCLHSPGAWGK